MAQCEDRVRSERLLFLISTSSGESFMRFLVTASLVFVLLPPAANAGMSRGTLRVSAQVINNCVADVPSSVALPAYDGTQVRSRADLRLRCTKGASPIISIGSLSAAKGAPRALVGTNGSQLSYDVFSDLGYREVWDSVTGKTADGLTYTSYTLYLEIPSGQTAPQGTYTGDIDIAVDPGTRIARHYVIPVSSSAP